MQPDTASCYQKNERVFQVGQSQLFLKHVIRYEPLEGSWSLGETRVEDNIAGISASGTHIQGFRRRSAVRRALLLMLRFDCEYDMLTDVYRSKVKYRFEIVCSGDMGSGEDSFLVIGTSRWR